MKKNYLYIILIGIIVILLVIFAINKRNNSNNNTNVNPTTPIDITNESEFDYKMIKQTHNEYRNKNYMISPLSIAYALSLVEKGALENTKDQIDKLLGDYKLGKAVNIKDTIGIANLIFISNKYKSDVSTDYINTLKKQYDSEVMFDDFDTPKPINDWVSKKTFNMINEAVKQIDKDFVLGLANAIAIDVEWNQKFECNYTSSEEFTKEDNTKIEVAMMHSSNDIAYIESKNAKGIVKDYAIYDNLTGKIVYEENDHTTALEYIAILPNTNIDEYMKTFNKDELKYLLNNKKTSSSTLDINLSLPKYTYDFDYERFKKSLIDLGMEDAFNPDKANFKKMLNDDSLLELYINQAIHKSHIELSENGTKAAAVTIFMMYKNTSFEPEPKEVINIEFNRPFIYIIKEKNSDNIWFFGTVYEPMLWKNNDSQNCKSN